MGFGEKGLGRHGMPWSQGALMTVGTMLREQSERVVQAR
jgi:hypothetical protein